MDTQHGQRGVIPLVIENFSFLWFTISMDTGLLSILMHQNPYQFSGLGVLSTIMFVFNLVLFTTFTLILLLRIFMFPKRIFSDLTTNLVELSMTGTIPIAWFTLVAQVSLTVSEAGWGSHAFTVVAFVMWWIGTAVMVVIVTMIFFVLAKYNVTKTTELAPALIIPFVGCATNAVIGGIIANYSVAIGARLAIPVIIVSYMMLGIAIFGATVVFAAYTIRLIDNGLPSTEQYPTLFLLVGPVGQGAAAAIYLGSASSKHFAAYNKGTLLHAMGGSVFSSVGVLIGLLLVGFAILFLLVALSAVVEGAVKRQHKYSIMWWGSIFPVATVNTTWIALATAMDSPTFRTLASIFLLALLVVYFGNWFFTLYHLVTGKVLGGVTFRKVSAHETLEDGEKTE